MASARDGGPPGSAAVQVPVLLVTSSYVEPADRELARRAGATDLLPRTPELVELIEALSSTLADVPTPRRSSPTSSTTREGAQPARVPATRASGDAQHRARQALLVAGLRAHRAHADLRGRPQAPRGRRRARRGARGVLRRGRHRRRGPLPRRRDGLRVRSIGSEKPFGTTEELATFFVTPSSSGS